MSEQASYYFWKWADNDLAGKPTEVFAALMRGELHPALQRFDARPLLRRLEKLAAADRKRGEEWEWQLHPQSSPENVRFVFLTCPPVNASQERVLRLNKQFGPLGLSGYDERGGHLISCLPPKLNCFITGQHPREPLYDITQNDLPLLLRRIRPIRDNPWGELWNRRNDAVVAIAEGRRYRVEWREVGDENPAVHFTQWRGRDAKRLAALGGKDDTLALPTETDPDFLTYADTLRIFRAFLCGQPRPSQYHWRDITKTVKGKRQS